MCAAPCAAPRAAKAVTFQDRSPDTVLDEPSAARRRNAFDDERPEEITFNPRSKPASAAAPSEVPGPVEFSAVAHTTQNPYSKVRRFISRGIYMKSGGLPHVPCSPFSIGLQHV